MITRFSLRLSARVGRLKLYSVVMKDVGCWLYISFMRFFQHNHNSHYSNKIVSLMLWTTTKAIFALLHMEFILTLTYWVALLKVISAKIVISNAMSRNWIVASMPQTSILMLWILKHASHLPSIFTVNIDWSIHNAIICKRCIIDEMFSLIS